MMVRKPITLCKPWETGHQASNAVYGLSLAPSSICRSCIDGMTSQDMMTQVAEYAVCGSTKPGLPWVPISGTCQKSALFDLVVFKSQLPCGTVYAELTAFMNSRDRGTDHFPRVGDIPLRTGDPRGRGMEEHIPESQSVEKVG